jgi:hypothetical protein|tara:strand:- start:1143 stop:1310 length:168 start_codon:yes stop_codon:yes gene_type:complete
MIIVCRTFVLTSIILGVESFSKASEKFDLTLWNVSDAAAFIYRVTHVQIVVLPSN